MSFSARYTIAIAGVILYTVLDSRFFFRNIRRPKSKAIVDLIAACKIAAYKDSMNGV